MVISHSYINLPEGISDHQFIHRHRKNLIHPGNFLASWPQKSGSRAHPNGSDIKPSYQTTTKKEKQTNKHISFCYHPCSSCLEYLISWFSLSWIMRNMFLLFWHQRTTISRVAADIDIDAPSLRTRGDNGTRKRPNRIARTAPRPWTVHTRCEIGWVGMCWVMLL